LREFFAVRPEVRLAYLFGSVAKDRVGVLSDVDVAVLVDRETLARSEGFDYEATLTTKLMGALRFPKIDLALLNGAPSLLRFMVVRDGILVREREPGLAIEFRVEAIRDYIDFEPARRIQRFYLRRSLGLPQEPVAKQ
jgi:predicted nucleotidyltransferase